MDSFHPEGETCPCCKAKGNCKVFTYYERKIIDYIDGKPVRDSLCVTRVICSCGATHAVLPDPVIPYSQHSLFFILRVLGEHFLRLKTVEKICEAYKISLPTFYRWLRLYQEHRRDWQGTLKSIEESLRTSFLEMIRKEPYAAFAQAFISQTGVSFLQSHRNPSHCRRKQKIPGSVFP